MKKIALACALLLALAPFAAAALLVTDSGVSTGTADNRILERKSSWDASQASAWITAWIKIPPGSDQEHGAVRYQYKVTITAPDKTAVTEGPFGFDADGYAKVPRQVSYFNGLKTTFSPNPCEGEWKVEFTIVDQQTGKEDLGALLPFYLTGSDKAQAPTDINEAKDKAVGETADMALLAVFNKTKEFGAQQAASTTTATSTTTVSSTTTTKAKKTAAKKKAVKKKKGKK